MPDWLTCSLPSVSAYRRRVTKRRQSPQRKSDYDPDQQVPALIPDDARVHRPGPAQPLDEHPLSGRPPDNRDALRVAVDALREQLERERGRADRLERGRDVELEATAKAEAQREYERGRVDQADRAQSQLGALLDAAMNARRDAEAALATAKVDLQASERVIAQLGAPTGPPVSRPAGAALSGMVGQ